MVACCSIGGGEIPYYPVVYMVYLISHEYRDPGNMNQSGGLMVHVISMGSSFTVGQMSCVLFV